MYRQGVGFVIQRLRVRFPAVPPLSATLGKLFTHVCLCSPSSIHWYRLRLGVKCTTGAVLDMLAAIRRTLRLAANRRRSSIVLVVAVVQRPWSDLSLTPLYKLSLLLPLRWSANSATIFTRTCRSLYLGSPLYLQWFNNINAFVGIEAWRSQGIWQGLRSGHPGTLYCSCVGEYRVKALVASGRAVPDSLQPRLRRCTRKVWLPPVDPENEIPSERDTVTRACVQLVNCWPAALWWPNAPPFWLWYDNHQCHSLGIASGLGTWPDFDLIGFRSDGNSSYLQFGCLDIVLGRLNHWPLLKKNSKLNV